MFFQAWLQTGAGFGLSHSHYNAHRPSDRGQTLWLSGHPSGLQGKQSRHGERRARELFSSKTPAFGCLSALSRAPLTSRGTWLGSLAPRFLAWPGCRGTVPPLGAPCARPEPGTGGSARPLVTEHREFGLRRLCFGTSEAHGPREASSHQRVTAACAGPWDGLLGGPREQGCRAGWGCRGSPGCLAVVWGRLRGG